MKVGDYVHNVPYDTYGVIVEELEPITDGYDASVVERRFFVLYDNENLGLTGSTFLKMVEETS